MLLVVSILKLSEDCDVYQIKLLLNVKVALLVIISCSHTLLDVSSETFKVDIQVSFEGNQLLMDHSFDHLLFEFVHFGIDVLVAEALYFDGDAV